MVFWKKWVNKFDVLTLYGWSIYIYIKILWIENKCIIQYFGWLLYSFSLLLRYIICIINVIFRNWRRWVADEIGRNMRKKGEPVCSDAQVEVMNICQKTVKDLNDILMELEEFQTCVLPVDQNKRKYSICTTRNKTKQTCSF